MLSQSEFNKATTEVTVLKTELSKEKGITADLTSKLRVMEAKLQAFAPPTASAAAPAEGDD